MTENDYLTWTRPTPILKCLGPRATRYQYLLFLLACMRRPGMYPSAQEQRALAIAEQIAFDQATLDDLREAGDDSLTPDVERALSGATFSGESLTSPVDRIRRQLIRNAPVPAAADRAEKLVQVNLLRCIVGNPYTPAGVDRAWLHWNDGAIPRLAETIHDDRRFDELPVLGDALEEAGCKDSDILGHCRTRREHAPGCWVLSLLRAKLGCRLVLSTPEVRLSGWRPDHVELSNITTKPVLICYSHDPMEEVGLLVLDQEGRVVDHESSLFARAVTYDSRTCRLQPGETITHPLGPTRTLPPGIYTMQARFRHAGIDIRSRAFLFTVSSQQ